MGRWKHQGGCAWSWQKNPPERGEFHPGRAFPALSCCRSPWNWGALLQAGPVSLVGSGLSFSSKNPWISDPPFGLESLKNGREVMPCFGDTKLGRRRAKWNFLGSCPGILPSYQGGIVGFSFCVIFLWDSTLFPTSSWCFTSLLPLLSHLGQPKPSLNSLFANLVLTNSDF